MNKFLSGLIVSLIVITSFAVMVVKYDFVAAQVEVEQYSFEFKWVTEEMAKDSLYVHTPLTLILKETST